MRYSKAMTDRKHVHVILDMNTPNWLVDHSFFINLSLSEYHRGTSDRIDQISLSNRYGQ